MQTIGEKLEEARKRQGISIRDAAEATKIRADFLVDYENNKFDQDLPSLYTRGFVKLYSRFLKIDVDKVASDLNALKLGYTAPRDESKDSLGRMQVDYSSSHYTTGASNEESSSEENEAPEGMDATVYWKIGIALGVAVGFLLLLILFINLISTNDSSSDEVIQAELVEPAEPEHAVIETSSSTIDGETQTITLVSTGICHVLVRYTDTREVIYQNGLTVGQQIPLEVKGRVEIICSDAQHLQIIKPDGTRQTNSFQGTGKIIVDL